MKSIIFIQASQLEAGDIIGVVSRTKHDHRGRIHPQYILDRFSCKITNIMKYENQIDITYVPCKYSNSVRCGFGCHFIKKDGNANGWLTILRLGSEPINARI